MGQTLSEPITSKDTSNCENEFFKVGSSCMQGWRISKQKIIYFSTLNVLFQRHGRRTYAIIKS